MITDNGEQISIQDAIGWAEDIKPAGDDKARLCFSYKYPFKQHSISE
jgi:hypothetical protein